MWQDRQTQQTNGSLLFDPQRVQACSEGEKIVEGLTQYGIQIPSTRDFCFLQGLVLCETLCKIFCD